jgi:hypothetical protein
MWSIGREGEGREVGREGGGLIESFGALDWT